MHVAARDSQSGVVTADGIRIGRLEQAVDLPFGVVEQLDLSDTELVGLGVLGVLGDLLDGGVGQLEVVVEIHELGHRCPLVIVAQQYPANAAAAQLARYAALANPATTRLPGAGEAAKVRGGD